MLARTRISDSRIGRRRRPSRPSPGPIPAAGPADAGACVSAREREAGVSHDEASYTCLCGFVFEALVSTSVQCPHCGVSQAW
ncbi:MAG: hypothetical protein ACRDL5_13690 [Solirubrobacteraceae bacterium]